MEFYTFFFFFFVGLDTFLTLLAWRLSHINMNVGLNQFEQTAVKPIDAYSSCLRDLHFVSSSLFRYFVHHHPSSTP